MEFSNRCFILLIIIIVIWLLSFYRSIFFFCFLLTFFVSNFAAIFDTPFCLVSWCQPKWWTRTQLKWAGNNISGRHSIPTNEIRSINLFFLSFFLSFFLYSKFLFNFFLSSLIFVFFSLKILSFFLSRSLLFLRHFFFLSFSRLL